MKKKRVVAVLCAAVLLSGTMLPMGTLEANAKEPEVTVETTESTDDSAVKTETSETPEASGTEDGDLLTQAPKAEEEPGTEEPKTKAEAPKEVEKKAQKAAATGETWTQKIEAESGVFAGNAKKEWPGNLGGEVGLASNLDQGEGNSVTLTVSAKAETTVKLSVHYRAGDDTRKLMCKVNGEQEQEIKTPVVEQGNWTKFKDSEPINVNLKSGENKLKFYAPSESNGPGIDYITLDRTDEKPGDVVVKFKVNGTEVATLEKDVSEEITADEVKKASDAAEEAAEGQGKDFLGWFYGGAGEKYEGVFPMTIRGLDELDELFPYNDGIPSKYKSYLDKKLDDFKGEWTNKSELVFNAKFGKHQLANEVDKPGYRLIFQDEFDDTALDKDKWVDRYLSSWSEDWNNTNNYEEKDGHMTVKIDEDTEPWCREFDSETVVTGFTTGQRNGLHKWAGTNQVRHPEDTKLTHINQYGYYEMRAKGQSGPSRHMAWWLTGFEDVAEESAEIDIFEVLGNNAHNVPPAIHAWSDSDAFATKRITSYNNGSKDFHNEWHVYGMDWQQGTGSGAYPDKLVFYVDGEKFAEKNVNIDYPMIQLVSLYEKRMQYPESWTGSWEWRPYPNSYEIDYVRVYKKLPEGQAALSKDKLKVTNVKAEDIKVKAGEAKLTTYTKKDGEVYTEKTLPGTKSYVRVNWNDGVETQEPVVWDPITEEDLEKLNEGKSIKKNGKITTLNNRPVTMKIKSVKNAATSSSEGLKAHAGQLEDQLKNLFDGNKNQESTSGVFKVPEGATISANVATINDDNSAIIYDFGDEVDLSGVDIWSDHGANQAIRKMKLQYWDAETGEWKTIENKGRADDNNVFTLTWNNAADVVSQGVDFDSVKTSKVKIILKEVGAKWDNKFAIKEITFDSVRTLKAENKNWEVYEGGAGTESGLPNPEWKLDFEEAKVTVGGKNWDVAKDGLPFKWEYRNEKGEVPSGMATAGEYGLYAVPLEDHKDDAITVIESELKLGEGPLATVTVRDISDDEKAESLSEDIFKSVHKNECTADSSCDVTDEHLHVSENVDFQKNGTEDVVDADAEVKMLWDDMLPENKQDKALVEELHKKSIEAVGDTFEADREIEKEFKYLNLVDTTDSNLWVSPSEGNMTVYVSYPEGVDKDHKIAVTTYSTVRGQKDGKDVPGATALTVEKMDEGITFSVTSDQVGLLEIMWQDDEKQTPPSGGDEGGNGNGGNEGGNGNNGDQKPNAGKPGSDAGKDKVTQSDKAAKTGDTSNVATWMMLFVLAGGITVSAVVLKKRQR